VVKLIVNLPCVGLLPKTISTVILTVINSSKMTIFAPFKSHQKSVSDTLKSTLGVGFPALSRTLGKMPRTVWCGRGLALIIGADCPYLDGAACIDNSDAWAIVRLDGADTSAILVRLTPIDLRALMFKRGYTARTLIGHITGGVTRFGVQSFEAMVLRSMVGTLVHELTEVAKKYSGANGNISLTVYHEDN